MEIITKINNITSNYNNLTSAVLLPLANFSVGYKTYFTTDDLDSLNDKDIFVVINKNIYNKDLEKLKEILLKLDKLGIKGVFFYDISLIELKKELNLKLDLVLDITHMVDNHDLINYYYSLGVKYVKLPSELTIDEIIKIKKNTNAKLIVHFIGVEDIAFSKRKLITNSDILEKEITIKEKISDEEFIVKENDLGTSFLKKEIFNGSSALEKLVDIDIDYILLNEDYIEHDKFIDILEKTNKVLDNKNYSLYEKEINNLIGTYNGFLYKDTIYKVKKDEKN